MQKEEMLNESVTFLQTIDQLKHKKEKLDDESQNTDNILGELGDLQRRLSIEEEYDNLIKLARHTEQFRETQNATSKIEHPDHRN